RRPPRHGRVGVGRGGGGHGLQQPDGLHGGGDVVDPYHRRPVVQGPDHGGQGAVLPLVDGQRCAGGAPDHTDEALAGRADQHRHAGRPDDVGQPGQEGEVVGHRLAEPEPGVGHELVFGDAGLDGGGPPLGQEGADLGHHVVVAGVDLHGGRRALHVHEDVTGAGRGHEREHGRVAPGGDVVDDGGTRLEGGGGHGGIGGV